MVFSATAAVLFCSLQWFACRPCDGTKKILSSLVTPKLPAPHIIAQFWVQKPKKELHSMCNVCHYPDPTPCSHTARQFREKSVLEKSPLRAKNSCVACSIHIERSREKRIPPTTPSRDPYLKQEVVFLKVFETKIPSGKHCFICFIQERTDRAESWHTSNPPSDLSSLF